MSIGLKEPSGSHPAAIISKLQCSVRDGNFVEPCGSLEDVLDGHAFSRGRALFLVQLSHIPTMTPSRSFVVLRMGKHTKKGIVLNCCPFCGERIDAPFLEAEDAA